MDSISSLSEFTSTVTTSVENVSDTSIYGGTNPSYNSKKSNKHSNKSNYVNLKINGRFFPSWILANFREYKLPDIIINPDNDPCNSNSSNKKAKLELRKYQKFIGEYMDYKSPYRDILIYHGLGSGKTASTINIYNILYNYTPGWNVFILLKASLKGGWIDGIKEWLQKDSYEHRFKNIIFISYDSPIADKQFLDAVKNVDSSKKSMFIIEECHNFIRNVYGNISSTTGKRAQVIYDYIIQEKQDNPDTRVILLSATPAVNRPFELALLFNLLRPNIFPKSEVDFDHLFVSTGSYSILNMDRKNLFQRRIIGLVSYYRGSTPDKFASQSLKYIDVIMSQYQKQIYNYYEDIEKKINASSKFKGKSSDGPSVYMTYTRQSSNYVFPNINQNINGETRPRPNKFKITEREAEKIAETVNLKADKNTDSFMNVAKYKQALSNFMTSTEQYYDKYNSDDIKNKYTILDDVEKFKTKYKGNFSDFHEKENKKSLLYNALYESSGKMVNIIFNIMKSPGPVLVYSNYVLMEGLEMFKIYLKYFNFYDFMKHLKDKSYVSGKIGYAQFHGGIKKIEDRYGAMKEFNREENKYGKYIKIMLVSPAGSEGLNLMSVRQVHIMEPYWNEVRIVQMIGRAIRQCSHKYLDIKDRHVDVYRYRSIIKNRDYPTTDQLIEDIARSKESLIQSFLDAVKEVAVDCELFKKHNMITGEYQCFKFEEPSLFEKYVGPAYKDDIEDDMRNDNGISSSNAITMKIKVVKIKAVKLLSDPEDSNPKYSKSQIYWYYSKSGIVYDYDMHYPVGRVSKNNEGIPDKLDKDTYIMSYVIPIPMINE